MTTPKTENSQIQTPLRRRLHIAASCVGIFGLLHYTDRLLGTPMTTVRQWCEQQRARRLAPTAHPVS